MRPWKSPSKLTISGASIPRRWACLRAILIAHSFASVPELEKKTRPPRLDSESRSASRTIGSV